MVRHRDVNTYDYKVAFTKVSERPSLTEPNMCWSLKELLDRHSRGLLTDVSKARPVYGTNVDHTSPDLVRTMKADPFEAEMQAKQNEVRLKRAQKARAEKLAAKQAAQVEAEKAAAVAAAVAAAKDAKPDKG